MSALGGAMRDLCIMWLGTHAAKLAEIEALLAEYDRAQETSPSAALTAASEAPVVQAVRDLLAAEIEFRRESIVRLRKALGLLVGVPVGVSA